MDRREYELNDEQHKRLLDACKPVPYIVVGGVPPASPQENANRAWKALGDELGFEWETVKPVPGKDTRFFTAVPTPLSDVGEEPFEAQYEGWYSRLNCGKCGEMFELEDDVQNGQEVECDACGTKQTVRRVL